MRHPRRVLPPREGLGVHLHHGHPREHLRSGRLGPLVVALASHILRQQAAPLAGCGDIDQRRGRGEETKMTSKTRKGRSAATRHASPRSPSLSTTSVRIRLFSDVHPEREFQTRDSACPATGRFGAVCSAAKPIGWTLSITTGGGLLCASRSTTRCLLPSCRFLRTRVQCMLDTPLTVPRGLPTVALDPTYSHFGG